MTQRASQAPPAAKPACTALLLRAHQVGCRHALDVHPAKRAQAKGWQQVATQASLQPPRRRQGCGQRAGQHDERVHRLRAILGLEGCGHNGGACRRGGRGEQQC